MIAQEILDIASAEVHYHEKRSGTPVADLIPKTNAYDGSDNWTKYHYQLGITQGLDWCGFFLYWCFSRLFNSYAETNTFLYNIINMGGGVDDWFDAFDNAGEFYYRGSAYTPKAGDVVLFSNNIYTYSHAEVVFDPANFGNGTIVTIGGNTTDPFDPGDQSRGMYVAQRVRDCAVGTGFRVLGYCNVPYDGTPSPGYLDDITLFSLWFAKKKRRKTWY